MSALNVWHPDAVVGLDTSAKAWHAVGPGLHDFAGSGEVKHPNADVRRHVLWETVRAFCAGLPDGTHVFCEESLALQNGKTTRLLGMAAGAIWAGHMECDLFWHWVNVSTWKKEVVGKGNVDKATVIQFVHDQGFEYPEPDYHDAWCLRAYGVQQLRLLDEQALES